MRLENSRVLVVGAGSRPSPDPDPPIGNGRAISVAAAREGAAVACADVDESSAAETADWIAREGGRAEAVSSRQGLGSALPTAYCLLLTPTRSFRAASK